MYFDTHAHLDSPRYGGDAASVIERARSAGVNRIVTCGSDLASSQACVDIAHAHEGISASAGIHPHEARSVLPARTADNALLADAVARMRQWAQAGDVVAIGEIGLDYHYDLSPRSAQQAVFERQLMLAAELDLPVILHNRESDSDFCALLQQGSPRLRGVLHCFMGGPALAEWALARGLYLGIAGPITFRNVPDLVAAVQLAPLDRLLIETDSPYLAPHPYRGQRNEPAHVTLVAQRVAELRGITPADVARITADNGCRLFGVV